MDLKVIISISGKPGLYRVVSQGKNTLIVEGFHDGKRFPAFQADKISALDDITMYTTDEDILLSEVFQLIWDKENGGPCIDHKEDAAKHKAYFLTVVENYDQERVYNSDLKKLFNWYNLLQGSGALAKIVEESKAAAAAEEKSEEKKEKKASAKKEKSADAPAEEKKETKAKKTTKAAGEKKETKAKSAAPKVKAESKAKTSVRTTSVKRGA